MRLSASPRDFRRQIESIFGLDAGDAPERITQPTLVLHVTGDRECNVASGRLLASLIPDAEFIEIPGIDHFSWVQPNFREIIDPIIEFVTGRPAERFFTRRFSTVLFTDIVGSTRRAAELGDAAWHELHDQHDRIARKIVGQHHGRVVKSTGDGLLIVFDVPSDGVACGTALCRELANLGVEVRGGLHAGEIEVHEDFSPEIVATSRRARTSRSPAQIER